MAIEGRLLKLGREEAFTAYQEEFDRLYRSEPIRDPLGRLVEFPPPACRHVCFKSSEDDFITNFPRTIWSRERAERIPWIGLALTQPQEMRPSHRDPSHQACWLFVRVFNEEIEREEAFAAYVAPQSKKVVAFLTAYPINELYRQKARAAGRSLYPYQPPKERKKKKGSP